MIDKIRVFYPFNLNHPKNPLLSLPIRIRHAWNVFNPILGNRGEVQAFLDACELSHLVDLGHEALGGGGGA